MNEEIKIEARLQDRPVLLEKIREELKNPYYVGKSNEEIVELINSGWEIKTVTQKKKLAPRLDQDGFQMTDAATGASLWDKVIEDITTTERVDTPVFRIIGGMKYSLNAITIDDLLEAIK